MRWEVWLITISIAASFLAAALLGWRNGNRDRQRQAPPTLHRPDLLVHGRSLTR